MDAVQCVAQIKRPRSQRIVQSPGHETRQMGIAFEHLGGRPPVRPFGHPADPLSAGPSKTFPADPDFVTKRLSVTHYEIKDCIAGVDHDGAGGFGSWIINERPRSVGWPIDTISESPALQVGSISTPAFAAGPVRADREL